MRRFFLSLLILLVLLGTGGFLYARHAFTAPGPLAAAGPVVVPRGGTAAIAAALTEAGVIADPRLFLASAWITRWRGPLRAAEFNFPAGASVADVLEILRSARPVQRRLTIPEGLTTRQIATLIENAEGLTGETPAFEEGELLPETYAFQLGDTRAALVRRAEQAMTAALNDLWSQRVEGLPLQNARQALILASIVERETGKADERGKVAGVFVNRLRRGMPLQSDPTVAYAAADGGVLDRPISRADLDREHPFNTYRVRGLPPGPIASPGRDSLRAVMRPDQTEFLYFVADGSGGHAFARSLEDHNRNVARWREIERARGSR